MADEEKPEVPPRLRPGDPGYQPFLDELEGPIFGRAMYFDRDGNPISMRQAGELGLASSPQNAGDPSGGYARIASDNLDEGNIWVSTVWLGLNHAWDGGPPKIFETMVFVRLTPEQLEERRKKWVARFDTDFAFPWEDLQVWRWSTEEEARNGHRDVVDSLRVRMEMLEPADGDGAGAPA